MLHTLRVGNHSQLCRLIITLKFIASLPEPDTLLMAYTINNTQSEAMITQYERRIDVSSIHLQ